MDPSTYTDPQLTYQDKLVIDAIVDQPSPSTDGDYCPAYALRRKLTMQEQLPSLRETS